MCHISDFFLKKKKKKKTQIKHKPRLFHLTPPKILPPPPPQNLFSPHPTPVLPRTKKNPSLEAHQILKGYKISNRDAIISNSTGNKKMCPMKLANITKNAIIASLLLLLYPFKI
jgi:hypothetical protein